LAFETVHDEIQHSRPVEVAYALTGGIGHVALVVQSGHFQGRPVVRVNDPRFGTGRVDFQELRKAYGLGNWFASWTGIRK
jgi:hypothetical protein